MKTNQIILLIASAVILVAVFYAGCRCGGSGGKVSRIDTVVTTTTDTVILSGADLKPDTVIQNFYRPYYITTNVHDTLEIFERIISPTDTAALLSSYFDTAFYRKSYEVSRGTVMILDTVTENRIVGRQLKTIFFDTVFTNTVVIDRAKRGILYIGTSLTGNKNELLYGAGFDLSFKQRNDLMYGAGVRFINGGQMYYEVQFKLPIKLKK